MAKPKARYTFSGVDSLSFTSHDVSGGFSDGESLTVDFSRGQGMKMMHEECRDFLKWYGKRDMSELKRLSKLSDSLSKRRKKRS